MFIVKFTIWFIIILLSLLNLS